METLPTRYGARIKLLGEPYYQVDSGGVDDRNPFVQLMDDSRHRTRVALFRLCWGNGFALRKGTALTISGVLFAILFCSTMVLVSCVAQVGERIVFQSSRGGFNVYVMSPDGSTQQPVLESGTLEWTPALSHDGDRIAFARVLRRRNPHPDIYVMASDGSNVTQVTDDPTHESFPTWSPDGLRIAFQASGVDLEKPPWPTDHGARIYIINVDGSNRIRLTKNDAAETTPHWSPDGKSILFASDIGGNWDIYVIGVDGAGQTRLTNDPGEDTRPVWSPDGTRVAFVSDREGSREIFVMRLNGGAPERLTHNSGINEFSGISWAPDGLSVAFGATRENEADIYVISLQDKTEVRLTVASGVDANPSWGPY